MSAGWPATWLTGSTYDPAGQIRSPLLRELLASVPGVRRPVAKFVGHIRPSVIDAASSGRKSSPSKAKLVRLKWGTISKRKPTAANAVGAGDVFTRAYEREQFAELTKARVSHSTTSASPLSFAMHCTV